MAGTSSIGRLTLDLVVRAGSFTQGMTAAERQANKSLSAIEKRAYKFGQTLGVALKAGAVAATAALTAVAAAVGTAINRADEMRDLSIRTGVATEKLSEYAYAAKQTGTDIDGLSRGLKLLAKNAAEAADAGSSKGKLFEALGVNVKDAAGNLKQLDVLLPEVADKFKGLEDGTTKAALAQELFGKSGLDLIEFLNQGSAGLTAAGKKVDEFGSKVGTEFAAQADEFNDKLGDLKEIANGFANQIAAELLPRLIELIDKFNASAKEGELLGTTVKDIGSIFDLFAGQVKKADDVGSSFRLMLAATRSTVDSLRSGLSDLVSLDVGGFIKKMNDARQAATSALLAGFGIGAKAPAVAPPATRSRNARGGSNRTETGGPLTDVAAINKYLGGDPDKTKSPKKSGKSDAEKEADKLKAAYDRMNESLTEQIGLFGVTGEAAKLRYDLEHGELSKLTNAEKESLIVKAEKLDQMNLEKELQDAAAKASEEEYKRITDGIKATDEFIDQLKFELELMGMTNLERIKAIELREWEGRATEDQKKAIEDLIEAQKSAADAAEGMDVLRDSTQGLFEDLMSGAKSGKEAFGDFVDSVLAGISRLVAQKLTEQLLGSFGSTGGGAAGGGWASLFASLLGGGKAAGGRVEPWSIHPVNELGMEGLTVNGKDYLMTGSQSGVVTPNHKLGGGGVSQNNQFIFAAPTSPKTQTQIAARTSFELRRAQRLGA